MTRRQNFRDCFLDYEKLEDRQVLDASFLLNGSALVLDGWDATDTLTIRETTAGDAYVFELAHGMWQGVDGNGVTGNGQSELLASKSAVDGLAAGMDIGDPNDTAMFDTVFENVDFSGLTGDLRLDTFSVAQATGSSVLVSGLQIWATSDLVLADNSTLRVTGDAQFHAGANIQIGHQVAAGQPAAARVNGAARFEAGGNLDFVGNTHRFSFSAGGAVDVHEQSALILFGQNQAISTAHLTANRAIIADPATSILVPELALSGSYIMFATSPQDVLDVSGQASLSSGNGMYVAPQGFVNFGSLTFNSGGFIYVTEDSDTHLTGNNNADAAYLGSIGSIVDTPTTTVHLNGNLILDAWAISLAKEDTNQLIAGGRATLTATHLIEVGAMDVLEDPAAANVTFGQLRFASDGFVTVNESDGMYLVGTNNASQFDLRSKGYLMNAPGLQLEVETVATFTSSQGIYLGSDGADVIHVCGEAIFAAPEQVTIASQGQFTTPVYHASSGYVDVNVDATNCYVQDVITQLNEALPDGWTWQMYDDGPDIRLVTYDANGIAANRYRFGATGVISQATDARTGRNLLAPSYQGESTDRVIQWTIWEVGKNAVYDVPGLPPFEDRFNMTQAGTFSGALHGTTDVDMDGVAGQLDVWSVVNRQWKSELEPYMDGEITALTRTQMLDGGGILIRRVLKLGDTRRLGTRVTIDSPYLVGWNTFSDNVYDSLAISIDAQGNPDVWWDDSNIPYFPNTRVTDTRGWATVYDRDNLSSGPTMSVIFGNEEGVVHQSDDTTGDPRYFVYNSMNFDGGMAINPGLATWQMPVGTIIDQYYLMLPGQGMDATTPGVLDQLAETLPAPQIYHPGSTLPADLVPIADRLNNLTNESRTATDHIGTLL